MMTSDVFKFRFINGEWTGQQTAHAITLGGPYGTTTFKYTIWSNQKKRRIISNRPPNYINFIFWNLCLYLFL